MTERLGKAFFNRPTPRVARKLLGKFLVRRYRGRELAGMITETEAYDGFADRGSHAHRGKTVRNAPMFGPSGCWYVYFVYGVHWMLNVTTREAGYPAAVLIRGVYPVRNRPVGDAATTIPSFGATGRADASGRPVSNGVKELSGPARLTKAFHIDKRLNGKAATPRSGLWVEDRGVKIKNASVRRSRRIGIDYAGTYWAGRRWRFVAELPYGFHSFPLGK
jgi:DNA-3-methyladenine glycosylase